MAGTLAKKLQLKPGQTVRILNAPEGLELDLPVAEGPDVGPASAVLVFVRTFAEAEERVGPAVDVARGDGLAWIAYPKAGQLGADINRDSLAALVSSRGARPVRQVAIDETWSALRFRPPAS